ncbi:MULTISPECIES: hypothetical protein [Bacillus]|uniref:hypothetical protein n=1 Tax=Bacillus TaxID=1386 RepID=UPI0007179051|nr:hypothetical protein [Bacillus pumilus]KRU15603.1 hypothetical protein AS142_13725 [Bacillus pumilus]MCY7680919.1 hypothetical protein [Bacillus pumilus]
MSIKKVLMTSSLAVALLGSSIPAFATSPVTASSNQKAQITDDTSTKASFTRYIYGQDVNAFPTSFTEDNLLWILQQRVDMGDGWWRAEYKATF